MKLGLHNSVPLSFSTAVYPYLAFMLLLVPLPWIVAVIISATIHELCHIAVIYLFRLRIYSMKVGPFGAVIESQIMPIWQEIVCALAGPFGGLCLLLFIKWIPRIALCAAFQSLYNLLPVYPSDGGRALRCLLHLLFSEDTAERIYSGLETLFLGCIIALGLYGTFWLHLGILPLLLVCGFVLSRSKQKKTLQR